MNNLHGTIAYQKQSNNNSAKFFNKGTQISSLFKIYQKIIIFHYSREDKHLTAL